MIRMGWQPNSW